MLRRRRRSKWTIKRRTFRRPTVRGRRGSSKKKLQRIEKTVITSSKLPLQSAFEAGQETARTEPFPGEAVMPLARWIQERFHIWRSVHRVSVHPWSSGIAAAQKFAEGYCNAAGLGLLDCLWMPTGKTVSVVLTAMNEASTMAAVLDQLARLPIDELIIVVNGSTDGTFDLARARTKAIIVHYSDALGHDVGRAIGAKLSRSEIVLFLDGDFPVTAEQLMLFVDAIERGADVALNNISPFLGQFGHRDSVTMVKELLNRGLGRRDLESNSLTAVPHALSKRAIEVIGYNNLAVPPKAHAIAVSRGLDVDCSVSVDVIAKNKVRYSNTGSQNRVADLIVGDHLEALSMLMAEKGARLGEPDRIRNRSLFEGMRA